MNTDLLIEALAIGLAQKRRKAQTFKLGSAARAEIEQEATAIDRLILDLQTGHIALQQVQTSIDTGKRK